MGIWRKIAKGLTKVLITSPTGSHDSRFWRKWRILRKRWFGEKSPKVWRKFLKCGDFGENREYDYNDYLAKNRQSFKEKCYEISKEAPWKNQNELSKFINISKWKICQHWQDNLNDLANRSLRRLVKVLAKVPIRWINFIFIIIFWNVMLILILMMH